jgi:hypothetical protein
MDDGRSRSRQDSVQRRRLEAQRVTTVRPPATVSLDRLGAPLAGPAGGRGAYRVTRPPRGRDMVGARAAAPRAARGSDSYPGPGVGPAGEAGARPAGEAWARPAGEAGARPAGDLQIDAQPQPAAREDDRTMIVAPRMWEPPPLPPVEVELRRPGRWVLPMTLATLISTGIVLLAVLLR